MKKTSYSTRFFTALLATLMCLSCFTFFAGAASDMKMTVNSPEVQPGGIVTIKVNVSGNTGVAGMDMVINFNNKHLTPVSISAGANLPRDIVSNLDDPSTSVSKLDSLTATFYGTRDTKSNGEFLVITFKVKEGVEDVYSAVTVSCNGAVSQDGKKFTVAPTGGIVTVAKKADDTNKNEEGNKVPEAEKATKTLKTGASKLPYMAGYSDGTFKPTQDATRYEVVECFAELFVIDIKVDPSIDFNDVDTKHKAMVRLFAAAGVINGYPSDNTFRGTKTITRAEFCKIVCQLLDLDGERAVDQGFNDVKTHWAADYINICAKEGLVNGKGNGRFDPDGKIKRSEVAKIINEITGASRTAKLIDGMNAENKALQCKYADVPVDAWYFGNVAVAAK